MEAHLALLQAELAIDPSAVTWAAKKLTGDAGAEACEKARWELTNTFLKPETKKEAPDWALARRIALVTLPFDRANACIIMKLDKNDADCPRGFLWINAHDLSELKSDLAWGETKQTHSIAKAYDATFVQTYSGSAEGDDAFTALLEPRAPHWMVEKFGLKGMKEFP